MPLMNKHWVLLEYPTGLPTLATWGLRESPVPEPKPGTIVVKAHYLSVDPYMRGRIAPARGYTKGVEIGETMHGGGVGEVIASSHPDFAPGDFVDSMAFGWQQYAMLDPSVTGPNAVNKVDPNRAPIQSALGWLGMPGITAFWGLRGVGHPKPGETVVISAASGAVGQLVGQIAKIMGARTVGIAGGAEKCAFCRDIGYDRVIDYRAESDLDAAVARECPDGIDVFWDNTAGAMHDAAMKVLATGARVIICGTISLAGSLGKPDMGERFLRQILVARATVQGFLVFDWWDRREEALDQLAAWHDSGQLTVREDVVTGIEAMPEAFLRLMHGTNFGKQLVKVA